MLMARYDCFTSLGYYALTFMDTVFFPLCVLEHKGAIGRTSISGFVVFFSLETLRPRPGFRQHTRCLQHTERTAQTKDNSKKSLTAWEDFWKTLLRIGGLGQKRSLPLLF